MTVAFTALGHEDRHVNWPGHPEDPSRLPAVRAGLAAAHLEEHVVPVEARAATRAELLRVHHPAYLDGLAALAGTGGGELDVDTAVAPGSWEMAVEAAGTGLAAIETLQAGRADAAFVALRPPGHHATAGRAMGFCLLNNIAVAAAHLTAQSQRVAIIDWDVHHGNGTQDIFAADPDVLFASTHQWPAYPGTGAAEEIGRGGAIGSTVNVPLPPGATGDVARLAFDSIIVPAVEEFRPDWVLVSAGFDAHRADPLAQLEWTAADFADLAGTVGELAPAPGRVVAFLEGGYDLDALAASAAATVAALAGASYRPERPSSGGPGAEHVDAAARTRRRALDLAAG